MSSFWTVEPETKPIELEWRGRSFTIHVKRELTAGEETRIDMGSFMRGRRVEKPTIGNAAVMEADVEMALDLEALTFLKVKTWLADWDLKDDNGQKMPVSLDTLRAMKGGLFKVIDKAIEMHAAEVADLEKKVPITDENPLPKISGL